MKDLFGLTMKNIDKLIEQGLCEKNLTLYEDGRNSITKEKLYVIGFDTSTDIDIAYDVIFNGLSLEEAKQNHKYEDNSTIIVNNCTVIELSIQEENE